MKMICIGDSLTYGYGVSNSECFISLVNKKLHINILNKGINGDTTSGIMSRSYKDIIQNHPSHVLIMIGHNDFLSGKSLDRVTDNLEEIIKECLSSKITTIVGIQPPIYEKIACKRWDRTVDYKKITKLESDYRNWIIKFCTKNSIFYIDFYECFLKELNKENADDLFIDGIHVTQKGHKIMARCLIELLNFI